MNTIILYKNNEFNELNELYYKIAGFLLGPHAKARTRYRRCYPVAIFSYNT